VERETREAQERAPVTGPTDSASAGSLFDESRALFALRSGCGFAPRFSRRVFFAGIQISRATRYQQKRGAGRARARGLEKDDAMYAGTKIHPGRMTRVPGNASARGAAAALVAALCLAGAGARGVSAGSLSATVASTTIRVSARVLEHTNLKVVSRPAKFVVTSADIGRGYVEVPSAVRVVVKSNDPNGYLLVFEVPGGKSGESPFIPVEVKVGEKKVRLSTGSAWLPERYLRDNVVLDVNCRFSVPRDAQPGSYRWPDNFTISAIPR
jgi:hypothetical protein